ncbi:MAG: HAD hydrolase family protein, partial [Clostridia bacterium]|nr:HAD hydrolase family protein [Clostridia bacterium]
ENLPEIPEFNQMSTMLDTNIEAAEITKKIEEKYDGILTPLLNGDCIDIVPFGVNKAKGIYELLKLVNGKYEDVIAVGDNINDTHMIKEFRSYAMANGVDYIKSIADYVTTGITELIEKELES